MKRIMVRYKVKPQSAAENLRLVEAVYADANRTQPEGIRYATFVLPDGVTFIHLFSNERSDERNPLGELDAFKAFQANLRERCEEPPVPTDLVEVGSYRFFDH